MKLFLAFIAGLFAASAPFLFSKIDNNPSVVSEFSGWPKEYEGRLLTQLELTEKEQGFVKDFPGKIGRFSDGQRELIIRWLSQPSRKLHPAADCFKGIGYYIKPLPININKSGIKMGCFSATKNSETIHVCEYIEDLNGKNWSDISAWYWGALLEPSPRGWMSYVVAE